MPSLLPFAVELSANLLGSRLIFKMYFLYFV